MSNRPKQSLEQVQDGLQDVATKLLLNESFYGHIVSGVNRKVVDNPKQVECTELRSLGISSVTMDVAYHLWEPMTMEEKMLRLKHEMIHYVFMHPWEKKPSNVGLFYIACDLSVNMYVNDTKSLSLSNFQNLCNRYNININTKDGWLSIYDSLVELYETVPQKVKEEDIPTYMDQAMKGDWFESDGTSLKESIFFLPKGPSGDMNVSGMNQSLEQMKESGGADGNGASEEEIQDFIQSQAEQPSDPWKEVSEGTSELGAKNSITRALKDAKARGDVPGNLSEYVDMFLSPPKIDWRRELRQFTSLMGDVVASTTMTRRSKRYKTFPSMKIRRTQRVAIAIDTSGSVSEEEFQAFMSEMRGALQHNCEVIFIQADAQVDKVDIYNKTLPEIARVERSGYGGTSFDDALKYIRTRGRHEDHKHLPNIDAVDGVVYMTDGYAPAPSRDNIPNTKLLWLTTQKSVEDMEREGFTGRIIKLDLDEN